VDADTSKPVVNNSKRSIRLIKVLAVITLYLK
jgi:hypothetical protein